MERMEYLTNIQNIINILIYNRAVAEANGDVDEKFVENYNNLIEFLHSLMK